MPTESAAKASLSLVEAVAEDPFYIPATALTSRPRRILKHGDSFIVLDSHGDIGATSGCTDGLFHCDTLHIFRITFLWHATAYQRLAVKNHGDRPIAIQLAVGFGNDFADLFEVRGTRRQRRGKSRSYTVDAGEVLLEYQGLDNELRSTRVLFDPAPTRLSDRAASYRVMLGSKQSLAIFVRIECNPAEVSRSPRFFRAMVASRRALKAATRHSATVQTSNDVFNEVLCRAMADLYMLITDTPQGPYPYAGIPWYSTTFGRDGLITALEMLWLDPAIARGVLRRLAVLFNDSAATE